MEDDGDVEVVRDRRRNFGDRIVRTCMLRVPKSEKFPESIEYAFHYGRTEGDEPIHRYDNHHGVHERHAVGPPAHDVRLAVLGSPPMDLLRSSNDPCLTPFGRMPVSSITWNIVEIVQLCGQPQ